MTDEQTIIEHDELDSRMFHKRFNLVVVVALVLFFAVAVMAPFNVVAGDWNFWTDWKDQTWWPIVTAGATMAPIAAVQYIGWRLIGLPMATVTAVAAQALFYGSHFLGFQLLVQYPANFTWPATIIPGAILLDAVLVASRGNWLLTGLIGGSAYGALFYPANAFLLQEFLQPVEYEGTRLTLANLQGFMYHRSATPDYLRIVGVGGVHTFAGQSAVIAAFTAGVVCIAAYGVGVGIGRLVGIWPLNRYLK